ncbi:hypothetical protein NO2_0619 [Candidatus Termititenax persephonae]|uniref:Uncharacterized protein n=1 Tax=Candidatus Termititenax persephonae TaxID=2218525 RepID=A0A388TG14_9BACT|nr:hypothetical protein NO2_0619 [Candidatus Termititenax persephonae]
MQKNKNKNLKSFGVDKPTLSHGEAVRNGATGGVASVQARRENTERLKLSAFLLGIIDDKQANIKNAVNQIIERGDKNLISLLKIIMDSTEARPQAVPFADIFKGRQLLNVIPGENGETKRSVLFLSMPKADADRLADVFQCTVLSISKNYFDIALKEAKEDAWAEYKTEFDTN